MSKLSAKKRREKNEKKNTHMVIGFGFFFFSPQDVRTENVKNIQCEDSHAFNRKSTVCKKAPDFFPTSVHTDPLYSHSNALEAAPV